MPPTVLDEPVGPALISLVPSSVVAASDPFTLRVLGTGLVDASVVRWDGEDRPTSFVSTEELRAEISAADVAQQGHVEVTVYNTEPDGGLSEPLAFTIHPVPNPLPVLTSLEPASASVGGEALMLTVLGSSFLPDSEVRWNGTARPTTFVSDSELTAAILAADIAEGGEAQVTVFNPAPGGGVSAALLFTIRTATAPVVSNVQVQTPDAQNATVMLDLTDPDGDVVQLSFTWFLNNFQAHQRMVISPDDIDLAGFTSGRLTLEFTGLGVETGFGPVSPNQVDIVATDAAGLTSETVKVEF